MKPTLILAAIIIIVLLATKPVAAQELPHAIPVTAADTLPTIKVDSIAAPTAKTDSLKPTKKAKRKKKRSDTGDNPYYQPGNAVVKPMPYNSTKGAANPVEKPILPVGDIIKDIIVPKKNK